MGWSASPVKAAHQGCFVIPASHSATLHAHASTSERGTIEDLRTAPAVRITAWGRGG